MGLNHNSCVVSTSDSVQEGYLGPREFVPISINRSHQNRAGLQMTLYDILGVSPTSSSEDIRSAYRAQARKSHPDKQHSRNRNDNDANRSSFVQVQEAYEVLRDEKARERYDMTLLPVSTKVTRISQEFFLDELQMTQMDVNDSLSICYSIDCRCGDAYRIWDEELQEENNVVPCDGCSLYIRIKTRQEFPSEKIE
uniref:Uncharacterized protein AlNc14C36G3178 n=1 Tax=Albugo laibachii Nc14 TaxID=890382 RepID=F0W8Q2_9STRA|nr:conserved hypothetical protein [Albugo laibachii Nc14]|eukprot:CCA17509.1 conserved hypothetical protein [Albugo laibachii Nc14]